MVQYFPGDVSGTFKNDSSTDNDDSDYGGPDPGREVVERNVRNRLQRIADHTKDELDKVLKRVDNVCRFDCILYKNFI
jgi:hypothetical protein